MPENGGFTVEHPVKMDDLGVALFLEIPIFLEIMQGLPSILEDLFPRMQSLIS